MLSHLKQKKAVSPMIAYIILITIVIVMAPLVYSWLKSYAAEGEVPECPDDVSLILKDYSCDYEAVNDEWKLTIELQNNGFFDIGGFTIKATTSENQELATQDLSSYYEGDSKEIAEATIMSPLAAESSDTTNSKKFVFDLSSTKIPGIYSIEITPRKIIEINQKEKWAYCDDARIKQEIQQCTKPA